MKIMKAIKFICIIISIICLFGCSEIQRIKSSGTDIPPFIIDDIITFNEDGENSNILEEIITDANSSNIIESDINEITETETKSPRTTKLRETKPKETTPEYITTPTETEPIIEETTAIGTEFEETTEIIKEKEIVKIYVCVGKESLTFVLPENTTWADLCDLNTDEILNKRNSERYIVEHCGGIYCEILELNASMPFDNRDDGGKGGLNVRLQNEEINCNHSYISYIGPNTKYDILYGDWHNVLTNKEHLVLTYIFNYGLYNGHYIEQEKQISQLHYSYNLAFKLICVEIIDDTQNGNIYDELLYEQGGYECLP